MTAILAVKQAPFDAMVTTLRRFVEMVCNLIIRVVCPNRNLAPRDALEATGRVLYVDNEVVNNMPRGEGDRSEVVFFKLDLSERGGYISDDDLGQEYELRGLKPADPYSLARANQDDPSFGDSYPNATHWKNKAGKWCFATFGGWRYGRFILVDRRGHRWLDDWWFAGLRK